MAGPVVKKGMVARRFGPTGKPTPVPIKAVAAAKARGGTMYEDGSVGGSGGLRGSKASPGPRGTEPQRPPTARKAPGPNARAVERANPNAAFKRMGAMPMKGSPAQAQAHMKAMDKGLPKPPPRRRA